MKIKGKRVVAFIMALVVALSGVPITGEEIDAKGAEELVYGDFKYGVESDDTIIIYNYTGKDTEIVIPEEIDGKSVTSIEERAFEDCSSLTSIEIPSSVTSIGDEAFSCCSSLTSIEIPSSVTSIGYYVFYGCSSLISMKVSVENKEFDSRENCNGIIKTNDNKLIAGCVNTKIPSSVTSIGGEAFVDCINLTSIEIPSGVTSIDDYAFYGCRSLTSIKILSGVTSIGLGVFGYCSSLTSIEIPSSVTSIRSYAFSGCSSLISIEIPSSVTSIDDYAFYGCSSLTSIEIPSSVTSIGEYVFKDCSSLTSIEIPSSVTSIGTDAFENCTNIAIKCYSNTEAYQYALLNNVPYELLGKSEEEEPTKPISKKVQIINVKKSFSKEYGAKPFSLNAKIKKGNGKLTYRSSNKSIATVDKNGKVKIKGAGICTFTVKASSTNTYKSASTRVTMTVKPKKNTISKMSVSAGNILGIRWKKDTKATGYELQYSTSKSFPAKSTSVINIKKNGTTSYKINKLTKGKVYYIRIRAYKTVKESGKEKKLYGKYSFVKKSSKIK